MIHRRASGGDLNIAVIAPHRVIAVFGKTKTYLGFTREPQGRRNDRDICDP